MVDCADGLTDMDKDFANILRTSKKPVYIAANKADNYDRILMANEFYALGYEEVFPISSQTGSGTGELLDSTVMPGIQGGPLMHIIAAKAVAFGEALEPAFKTYCGQIVANAASLAESFLELGYQLVSGGTDTHLILVDLSARDISGKAAEQALEAAGLTVNKNMVPFDERSPMVTSGIRIGTPAVTTRGMGVDEMVLIAGFVDRVLRDPEDEAARQDVRHEVTALCQQFPLYQA